MSGLSLSPLITAPSRSSAAPVPGKSRHHHRIHHPHRHRRHHDHGIPQSATLPSTSRGLGDLVKGSTGDAIKGIGDWDWGAGRGDFAVRDSQVREEEGIRGGRNAGVQRMGVASRNWVATAGGNQAGDERDREKQTAAMWKEARKIKERRREGESDLLTALSTLSTLGTTTTRRLDYTYYSLLSSIPLIRSTLSDLSALSQQTTALHAQFTQSAIPSLIDPVTSQISANRQAFDSETQERITGLEERMKGARAKAQDLGRRVERTRETVEAWEARRSEQRRRSVRKMQALWGILGGLVGVFLVLVVVRGWGGDGVGVGTEEGTRGANVTARLAELETAHMRERANMRSVTTQTRRAKPISSGSADAKGDVDPRLRLFDEL